jgi:hypothetical protein
LEMSALKRPGVYSRRQKHAMTTTNKATDKARAMNDALDAQKGTTTEDSTTKRTRRRRHDYSPEIADLICERLMEGASLRQICQDANMPARSTIFVLVGRAPRFCKVVHTGQTNAD